MFRRIASVLSAAALLTAIPGPAAAAVVAKTAHAPARPAFPFAGSVPHASHSLSFSNPAALPAAIPGLTRVAAPSHAQAGVRAEARPGASAALVVEGAQSRVAETLEATGSIVGASASSARDAGEAVQAALTGELAARRDGAVVAAPALMREEGFAGASPVRLTSVETGGGVVEPRPAPNEPEPEQPKGNMWVRTFSGAVSSIGGMAVGAVAGVYFALANVLQGYYYSYKALVVVKTVGPKLKIAGGIILLPAVALVAALVAVGGALYGIYKAYGPGQDGIGKGLGEVFKTIREIRTEAIPEGYKTVRERIQEMEDAPKPEPKDVTEIKVVELIGGLLGAVATLPLVVAATLSSIRFAPSGWIWGTKAIITSGWHPAVKLLAAIVLPLIIVAAVPLTPIVAALYALGLGFSRGMEKNPLKVAGEAIDDAGDYHKGLLDLVTKLRGGETPDMP